MGAVGKLISDTTVKVLTGIGRAHGKQSADEFADGYVDGVSRYWDGEEDANEIAASKAVLASHTLN